MNRPALLVAAERGLGVLFITHDLGEAVQLCDRIVVLKDGVAVESANPQLLVEAPAHPCTSDLLGAATDRRPSHSAPH